jgi:tetratricopeptide (TPR) repeat protein
MQNKIKIKIKKYLLTGYAEPDNFLWNLAIWAYKKCLVVHPNAFIIWMQLGNSARDAGLYEDAASAYAKAMSIDGQNTELFLAIEQLEKNKGDIRRELINYLNFKDLGSVNVVFENDLKYSKINKLNKLFLGESFQINYGADSQNEKLIAPENYSSIFKDVNLFVELGLVANAEQHFKHYGYRQGRDILASLHESPPTKAIVLCPSYGKRCGIGEHSRYIAFSLEQSGMKVEKVRTTTQLLGLDPEFLHNSVVIVNHGPGLFDGYNPQLSEGEPTIRLVSNLRHAFEHFGARPIVFMHSLLDRENPDFFARQQMMMEMPIPKATTILEASRVFNIAHIEHGMQPLPSSFKQKPLAENIDRPTIGFFGFYQYGGKNFDALFSAVQQIKGKLVGSVAALAQDIPQLRKMLEDRAIEENLGTGWVEDDELAERLSAADFHYLPQYDYDHWNNSGTARFAMNFGRPVIVPPHIPFLDLREHAIFADENDLPSMFAYLRTPAVYKEACNRTIQYAETKPMTIEMVKLAVDLPAVQVQNSLAQIRPHELICLSELLQCNAQNFEARINKFFDVQSYISSTRPLSSERRDQILELARSHSEIVNLAFAPLPGIDYWREHYELRHLYRQNAHECFTHVIRSLLKREPGLSDEVLVTQSIGVDISDISLSISSDDCIKLVTGILGLDRAVPFSRPIQIYTDAEPVHRESLSDPTVVNKFKHDIETMLNFLAELKSTPAQGFGHINDLNIFAALLLPSNICANRIAQAVGLNQDFESDVQDIVNLDPDLHRRFLTINNLLHRSGKDLLDVMLLDWPIIGESFMARNQYHALEFSLFRGSEFILAAYRALLKRDPTVFEQMNMEVVLDLHGCLHMLKHLGQSAASCASVIDVDDFVDADLDRAADLIRPLIDRFRSPIAGGWDLRNRYLVERRHASRALLRLEKGQEDEYVRYGYSVQADRQVMSNLEQY